MAQVQRTGRRAVSKLVTSAQAPSATSAYLPRATRRRRNHVAASADAVATFGALLEFSQANGTAEIDYSTAGLSTNAATYEVWIKTTVTSKQMLFQTAYTQPFIYIENNQIAVQWVGANSDPNYRWVSADTAVISDGEWHHIAVVFNNGAITFYKDGIATADTLSVNQSEITNHPVFMGGAWADVPAFIGQMWDIKIWAFAFTAELVQSDMYNAIPADALATLEQYRRLTSAISVATNTFTNIVNGGTATLTNCEVTWDVLPQPPTYAFELTGSGADYVDIGGMTQVTTSAATFECWMQMSTAAGVNANGQTLMLCRSPGDSAPLIAYNSTDRLSGFWPDYIGSPADTRPISDGAWHHIAVVFNNNVVTFYKDGIPINETVTLPATQTSGGDLQVGAALGGVQTFNGRITDVRVWNVARALGDIQGNMYTTLVGTESGLVGLNNLSYYSPSNTAIKNMVNGNGGGLAGNAKVVPVLGPQSQQPVPQNVWVYNLSGVAPLGPQISPKGLIYGENVYDSNNGPAGNYLRSLDLQNHSLNWTYSVNGNSKIPSPVIPASISVGNTVAYVAAQESGTTNGPFVELHAVDLGTGKLVWPTPARLTTNYMLTKPVEAGSIVVLGAPSVGYGGAGVTVFWTDTALGQRIQSVDIPMTQFVDYMSDPLIQTASSSSGAIKMAYFIVKHLADIEGNYSAVVALNMVTKAVVWQKNYAYLLEGGMAIDQSRLYVTSQSGTIIALNLSDGSTAWTQTKSNLTITSKSVVIGTAVYVGSTDGNLYALDGATGNELWRLNAGSAITTDLITEDGAIYFATQGNGKELPPTFYSVDSASQGNDTLIYPVPDADTILFDQGQSNGVVYFYSKQSVYAVNMDLILHEFNVDTKLTVEDYDTSTSSPVGNDTSYRITLMLNDPLKVPRVNQAVKIWASGTVYLTNRLDSNGKPIQVGPNTPFLTQTDAGGQVSLAVSAYDDGSHGGTGSSTTTPLVNCPAIYAWANFMMPGEAIVIYPDHEHMSSLANVQGQGTAQTQAARSYAVTNSTLYLNQATTYGNSKLISSDYQDSTSLTNIASTIRNTIGTRNSASVSRASASQVTDSASNKYIAYPDSMPNVNYASDNTQPVTRPYVPASGAANQTFTMDMSGANGPATVYQAGTFDGSRPSNLPAPSVSAASSTRRIHIDGIGEVEAIDSIGDFFSKVIKGAEQVKKMAWQWASNAVNTIIHTAESIYTLTIIQTLEDAVTAVVGFFKSIVADLKKVIEWLSALFDWGAILANHNTIKGYITNTQGTGVFDKMQAWIANEINVLGTVESDITNVFGQINGKGQSTVNGTGQGLAGQTVQSQQGPNSNPNDAYNTGSNNNATQCKFMQHKAMENGTGLSAPAPYRPHQLYMPWIAHNGRSAGLLTTPAGVFDAPDADTIINAMVAFVDAVGAKIASDFKDFPDQVHAAVNTLKDKFKDPKSIIANGFTDVLAVLAVIADDMIALGVEIAKDFLTLVNTLLGQLMALANETIDLPFVSRLYQSITGNPLTLLDLVSLVGAVPTTILMEVLTGAKTPSAAAALRAKALAQPLSVAIDEVGQIFLGIFNFAVNAFGSWLDAYTFWWNGTVGDTTSTQTQAGRADAIKGFFAWAIGMAVSQAWHNWGPWDWFYWGSQVFPVFYNIYGLFFQVSTLQSVDMDVFSGLVNLVLSSIWAGLWPSNYLNAPKARALTLFTNIFGSLGYLVEAGYYAQAAVGQDTAASLVALGKLILEEVNAILGFTAYVLTVVYPPSSATAQHAVNLA